MIFEDQHREGKVDEDEADWQGVEQGEREDDGDDERLIRSDRVVEETTRFGFHEALSGRRSFPDPKVQEPWDHELSQFKEDLGADDKDGVADEEDSSVGEG